ncbi:hypothetical protein L1281_000827 [Neisseria sp. HSC-16F19]|nr:hypothetical protein [Neisseria sp. HSC-16F19]MCP2040245.1 hypothetical protein [Neisseria sp. HSC-16F19]
MELMIATTLGGLIGGLGGLALLGWMAGKAQAQYPHARIQLPPDTLAEKEAELARWGAEHGYRLQPSLVDKQPVYRKGRGWLTSATEIRLHPDGTLDIDEVVNFLITTRRFALNAPVMIGQPVRARKLKAVNQLLAQWQLPPLRIGGDKVKLKVKS